MWYVVYMCTCVCLVSSRVVKIVAFFFFFSFQVSFGEDGDDG